MAFTYRTYEQFHRDIACWLPHVPQVSAVAGVPRSGVLAAFMISQLRHIPLVPLESLTGNWPAYRPKCSRRLYQPGGPVLVIDDTCSRGTTKAEVRKFITREDVLWGAVYATDNALQNKLVDVAGYRITTPYHAFSWNLLRDGITGTMAVDFDGVLCPDWTGGPHDCGPEYVQWLETVPVMCKPDRPVRAIITARLERFRPQTEAWLKKHGIEYGDLLMHPGDDPKARNPVGHKVECFRRIAKNTSVFVESCPKQAAAIAKATGWAVLCFQTGECHNANPMVPLYGAKAA